MEPPLSIEAASLKSFADLLGDLWGVAGENIFMFDIWRNVTLEASKMCIVD
jgi:hypothetical protein